MRRRRTRKQFEPVEVHRVRVTNAGDRIVARRAIARRRSRPIATEPGQRRGGPGRSSGLQYKVLDKQGVAAKVYDQALAADQASSASAAVARAKEAAGQPSVRLARSRLAESKANECSTWPPWFLLMRVGSPPISKRCNSGTCEPERSRKFMWILAAGISGVMRTALLEPGAHSSACFRRPIAPVVTSKSSRGFP